MIETQNVDGNLAEAEFYSKPFYFSYSALNRLLTAPSIFYQEYILKNREIKTEKHLLEGQVTHYLVLENLNYDDKFVTVPELPSPNSMKVATMVFDTYKERVAEDVKNADLELKDFVPEVLEILEEINLHQSVGEDKRAYKVIEPKTEKYFEFLKKAGKREIVDSGILDKCTIAADEIKKNQKIRKLLGMDLVNDGIKFGVYNELDLRMELEGFPFGLRGIIDNMVVDVDNKTVYINDFKTTSKSLVDFPESVEYWNYWLQAVIYLRLAMDFLKTVVDNTWTFQVHFVVSDQYNHSYAFPVSNDSLMNWFKRTNEVMAEAKWHYENKNYTLPYKFVAGEVTL